jgi:hypothetical protein
LPISPLHQFFPTKLLCFFFPLFKIRYISESSSLTTLKETSQTLSLQVVSCEKRAAQAEADLRIEREWRSALQEKEIKHKDQINNLQMALKKMNEETRVRNNKSNVEFTQISNSFLFLVLPETRKSLPGIGKGTKGLGRSTTHTGRTRHSVECQQTTIVGDQRQS